VEGALQFDRTGVRLIVQSRGGLAKMAAKLVLHPSNIHDTRLRGGHDRFHGDMPVILGPDGPSLGGFVCPVTIVEAELWKIGQLKPATRAVPRAYLSSKPWSERAVEACLETLSGDLPVLPATNHAEDPILSHRSDSNGAPSVVCRADGDKCLLVEYGPMCSI